VLPRREVRSNYGVEGVPIREQIVQRDGDVIITRNSYGALCLNSPDVLFADIDHAQPPAGCVMPAIVAAVLLAGAVIGTLLWHWLVGLVLGVAAVLLVNAALLMRRKQRLAAAGGAEGLALKRVDAFSEQHPDWHLRVYRTPAGCACWRCMPRSHPRTSSCRHSSRHWAPTPCTRACAGCSIASVRD
jgi:hypothetical protein